MLMDKSISDSVGKQAQSECMNNNIHTYRLIYIHTNRIYIHIYRHYRHAYTYIQTLLENERNKNV